MWSGCIISMTALVVFEALNLIFDVELISVIRTTALTVFYHLGFRLLLGEYILPKLVYSKICSDSPWFRTSKAEGALYKKLNIKRFKDRLPTYNPNEFSLKEHSLEEIVEATCRAEIIHEVNFILSFLPLLFSLKFGAFLVFLITSLAAACFDLLFVIVQRYNRPRILRIIKLKRGKTP